MAIERVKSFFTIGKMKKAVCYFREHGVKAFFLKIKEKILHDEIADGDGNIYSDDNVYSVWIKKNEPAATELEKQKRNSFNYNYNPKVSIIAWLRRLFSSRNYNPKISIIVPAFNTPEQLLIDMIESVINQTYFNWEICIADGGSSALRTREILNLYMKRDARIKVKFLTENKGIAGNSNEALSLATGDFVALLDHDDTLAPFALFEIVKAINENIYADFFYSDEDKISEDGRIRLGPHFKPNWSPDTLRSYNYITHLSVFKKELVDRLGGFRGGCFDGSQDYDLILRVTELTNHIVHIPKILYHWRITANSVASGSTAKPYAYEAAKRVLREHIARIGLQGEIRDGGFLGSYRISYKIEDNPKVSIIIPNSDQVDILRKCLDSIFEKTIYKNYEIIIVENNSLKQGTFDYYRKLSKLDNVRIIKLDKSFNYSAVNNFGAKHARGEILLFLNNDTEVISSDWLENMVEHVLRNEVGAVGAKLYYPDGTIQHAGLIVGLGGSVGHTFLRYSRESLGYIGRLTVIQNLSAVTGACIMVKKEIFEQVNGFCEDYPLALSDVDFCLKIREKGYLIVWTPYAELYHHESKTRGYEDTKEKQERFKKETELFKRKWRHILEKGDPYYNPNLTLTHGDFSLKV